MQLGASPGMVHDLGDDDVLLAADKSVNALWPLAAGCYHTYIYLPSYAAAGGLTRGAP